MARTKASVGTKVSASKSTKARSLTGGGASMTAGGSSSGGTSGGGGGRGNPVCPRETPVWQKPITRFFIPAGPLPEPEPPAQKMDSEDQCDSSPEYSDDDEELQPLQGENCHKINEYFHKKRGSKKRSRTLSSPNENCKRTKTDKQISNEVANPINVTMVKHSI